MELAERRMSLIAVARHMVGQQVTVVGDPVLDCYVYGTTHRISREAPVLIVREDRREFRLGGAANTAANLAALGVKTRLVGLVGNDADGARIRELAEKVGIDTSHVIPRHIGCTVTKTRVLAGGLNTRKQQMLRIDRENDLAISRPDLERLGALLAAIDRGREAIVVSDYGAAGEETPLYARFAEERHAKGQIVVVDSRYALSAYRGVTAVTPNEPEVEASLGLTLKSEADAMQAAERLTKDLALDVTVITRGREGMVIAPRARPTLSLPVHGREEAVDVTGAGDTVAATFTAALAADADVFDAAVLANCAASVVVRSVGAATCSVDQLVEELLR